MSSSVRWALIIAAVSFALMLGLAYMPEPHQERVVNAIAGSILVGGAVWLMVELAPHD